MTHWWISEARECELESPKYAFLLPCHLMQAQGFTCSRGSGEAWAGQCRQKGGMDAERAEHLSIGQATRQANDLAFESIQRIRREGFQKVRGFSQRPALPELEHLSM